MAKKISELPSTTTPPSTVEIAVVDSGTTKKTTAARLVASGVDARFGWFDAGHLTGVQGSLGTTETKVLVDGNLTFQGGYDNLPLGLVEADVYDKTTSRIKTDWLSEGQMFLVRVTGEVTTSAVNTGVSISLNFYDNPTDQTLLFTLSQNLGFFKSNPTTAKVSATEVVFISSSIAADLAYMEVGITFDGGASNEINMGGFTVAVIY